MHDMKEEKGALHLCKATTVNTLSNLIPSFLVGSIWLLRKVSAELKDFGRVADCVWDATEKI